MKTQNGISQKFFRSSLVIPFALILFAAVSVNTSNVITVAQADEAAAPADSKPDFVKDKAKLDKTTKLQKIDKKKGKGAEAKSGQKVTVHYTGWLTDGTKFDSSKDRNQPFPFDLGAGHVIKGWDEGVAGMKVGGQRRLIIPADMGYGERGAPPAIPPNSVLVFDVELLGVDGG
jgi:FKBP-type peptidyl-prolyl cis-trans isomerase